MRFQDSKRAGESMEVLDAIGHENEKTGIKWTKYFMDLWDKRQWEQNQIRVDRLSKKARYSREEYQQLLGKVVAELLVDLELPIGYKVKPFVTKSGVGVELQDKWDRRYKRAIKPCGTPKVDLNVVKQMVGAAEESAWHIDEQKQAKNGIYLT